MEPHTTARHHRGGRESNQLPDSETAGFAAFGLKPALLRAADKLGWTVPTPVQLGAIPLALDGRDLIGLAQTGTGKTGAFLLPLLDAVSERKPARPGRPYCLIIAPTRELARQIDEQAVALGRELRVGSMTIYGGVSEQPQIARLRRGVELVTATPGRLLDLLGQGAIRLDDVAHCVLDEADRMFDMGFIRDLRRILALLPKRRQTLLFSATMPPEIRELTREFLLEPREVRLEVSKPPDELSHEVWEMGQGQKNDALALLLKEGHSSVLVFTRTKHRANSLAKRLENGGEAVAVLHGNRSQSQRDIALARFKRGEARVLVATDVASRGLDIVGISLVVNFDTPRDPDDYVHRVGRTARAKRQGCAVSFLTRDEVPFIQKIEKLLRHNVARRDQQLPRPAAEGVAELRRQSAASRARPANGQSRPNGNGSGAGQPQPGPRRRRGRNQTQPGLQAGRRQEIRAQQRVEQPPAGSSRYGYIGEDGHGAGSAPGCGNNRRPAATANGRSHATSNARHEPAGNRAARRS